MINQIPAAMMWKMQGFLYSPTIFRLQHIKVPYSSVRVGVKVSMLVDPLVRINRLVTVLASAELLKVHLKQKLLFKKLHSAHCTGPFLSSTFFPPNDRSQNHAQVNPLLVLFLMAQKFSGANFAKLRSEITIMINARNFT
jgi:hypothetical protein